VRAERSSWEIVILPERSPLKKYLQRRIRLGVGFGQRSHRSGLTRNELRIRAKSDGKIQGASGGRVYLISGILSLMVGVGLSMWVLAPPPTFSEFPTNHNVGTIAAYGNGKELIEGVEYTVGLIPNPTTEDVLVIVATNLQRSAATRYEVDWPGRVRLHQLGSVEAAKNGDGEVLGVSIDWEGPTQTRLKINSSDDRYYARNDRFIFIWVKGKDKLTFADRRIRLNVIPVQGSLSVKVSFLGSQRLIAESPPASQTEPDTEYGGVSHLYKDQRTVVTTFTENNEQILAQFILLLAGILIGLSTNLLTQFIAQKLEERRRSVHHL